MGDPLQHVASSRGKGVGATHQTRQSPPALTLAGHGVSMRIVGGALTIQNGFTHYPQKRETIRFFKGDLSLPERIILLDGSGSVSFDVLSWLAEQKVTLIRIDWKGDVVCVAGASGYSANPFRVRWQLETREDPAKRNEFCRSTNHKENRSEHYHARKINSPLRQMGAGDEIRLCGPFPA